MTIQVFANGYILNTVIIPDVRPNSVHGEHATGLTSAFNTAGN